MELTTRYLGLSLSNPLIASASPLNLEIGNIRALEDNGAAAVVLPSLFEEQLQQEQSQVDRLMSTGADSFPEAISYFPPSAGYRTGPAQYLETIRRATEAVDIPVIASLNGITAAGWTEYACLAQEAGAAAVELNVFFIPADLDLSAGDVERRYLDVLAAVKGAVSIPVALKLSPYFSALGHFIRQAELGGADGFVLFNRFYQPDINLAELRLQRDLVLSQPSEIRLPLLWIGLLSGRIRGSLAATTGVETADEVIKYLLVGADTVMTTSALLRHGIGHVRVLRKGLEEWLGRREIPSLQRIRGRMSQLRVADPIAFERANYIRILQGWSGEPP